MDIRALKSLASKRGSLKSVVQYFLRDLKKEFLHMAFKEFSKHFKTRLVFGDETKSRLEYITTFVGYAKTLPAMRVVVARLKSVKWLRLCNFVQTKNGCVATFTLNPTALKKQLDSIKDEDKRNAALGGIYYIKAGLCIFQRADNDKSLTVTHKKKGKIINANSFTLKDFHIKRKSKYSLSVLMNDVDAGISMYPTASNFLKGIVSKARSLSESALVMKTSLTPIQLKIIQKNFLPIAAAISALSANPKSTVMFVDNGFVLFKGKEPIGRFGAPLKEKRVKKLFSMCKDECMFLPGDRQAIMDVLDAEGKPSDKCLKEVFNDFAKHIYTNSSGPAAHAATKIKHVARVTVGRMDWTVFKKSFDDAAKRIKDIEYDPMMDEMKKVAIDLNRGRGVIDPFKMNWLKTFEKKDLKWLGTLAADILEEEVNTKSSAKKFLSCVANWKENVVDCKLVINHLGSEGEKAVLSPCKKFYTGKWKIELQGIVKGNAGWSKSR